MNSSLNKSTKFIESLYRDRVEADEKKLTLTKGNSSGELDRTFSGSTYICRRSSTSIRRSKTAFDMRAMLLWDDTSATDFVTPYLRMKMQQRLKRNYTSRFYLQASGSFNSSSRSSQSSWPEKKVQKSSEKV